MLTRLRGLARRIFGRIGRFRYAVRPEGIEYVPYGRKPIEVALSRPPVSDAMRDKIISGVYEHAEARSIQKLFDNDEVVVELGGGVGLISTMAMRSGKVREVHVFEADARLVPLIEATHRRNGLEGCTVHNYAVTGDTDALARGYVDLILRENFSGNSLHAAPHAALERARVQCRSLGSIIEEFDPTILIVDIEGAEDNLFAGVNPRRVKCLSIEIHPHKLRPRGVRRLFNDLHEAGFYYDARHSHGAVPVFSRKVP